MASDELALADEVLDPCFVKKLDDGRPRIAGFLYLKQAKAMMLYVHFAVDATVSVNSERLRMAVVGCHH